MGAASWRARNGGILLLESVDLESEPCALLIVGQTGLVRLQETSLALKTNIVALLMQKWWMMGKITVSVRWCVENR